MKVITKLPGENAKVTEWPEMTQGLQTVFDMPVIALNGGSWLMLAEDNGYAMKLQPNFRRVTDGWIIVGPVVFVGNGREDFTGLSQNDITQILNNRPYEGPPLH